MNETYKQPSYGTIKVDNSLELQALCDLDADKLFQLTDKNRSYLAKYLPWVDKTLDANDSLHFIKSVIEKRASGDEYGFGIILRGELVGHISLMHLNDSNDPEIGYWVDQATSGKGVATKSAKALTDFGLNVLGQKKILIRARVDNIASNKIPKNLGYTFEGTHIDEDGENLNHWVK